jgi:hypothetical protein
MERMVERIRAYEKENGPIMGEQNMAYDRMKPKCASAGMHVAGEDALRPLGGSLAFEAKEPARRVDLGPPAIGQMLKGGTMAAGPIERKLDANKEQAQCLRQSLYDLRHKLAPVLPMDQSKTASEGEPSSGSSPLLGDLEDVSNIIKNCQAIVAELMVGVEL